MKTCEKMCLNSRPLAWQGLRDMRELRDGFNPCLYYGDIYLCGCNSSIMEAFSVQSEQFIEPFDIRVPTKGYNCCVFVDGGALVVHSNSWVMAFRKGEGLVAGPQVTKSPTWSLYLNTQPVLAGNLVFLSFNNQCVCFHARTGVQTRSAVS